MQGINIYEQPALLEISVESTKQKHSENLEVGQMNSLCQLFQNDFSLNKTPVRAVKFTNQFIDARWGFVFDADGNYILQSEYLKPKTLVQEIFNKRTQFTKLNSDHIYFMAYNHDYGNYYHWTIQCLPTLNIYFALKLFYPNLKLLFPSNLSDFALQYLKYLDIDIKKEVEFIPIQNELFFVENLIYPSLLGGEFAFNTTQALLNFSNACFSKELMHKASPLSLLNKNTTKLLYCSRLDSKNRKITNENEVIDFLKSKFGVKIYSNTGQNVKDQAKMFYDADIIIAPHGAGLSNIVFCQPNTTIIELLPDKYLNPCFATLAINKGCKYYPLVSPTTTYDGHQHEYEWQVNINSIEAILTSII